MEILERIDGWSTEDLSNLASILGVDNFGGSPEEISLAFKWLYYSKSRAALKTGTKNIVESINVSVFKGSRKVKASVDDVYSLPSYDELLLHACKQLKIEVDNNADIDRLEIYLSEGVIVNALEKMKPAERHTFFSESLDAAALFEDTGFHDKSIKGPMRATAILAASNAAGFGLYTSATTALGFATHAVGITLPFAAYTGLTSSIAFVIGPAGWLAAGFWAFMRLTGSEWKKLLPAILYIISINSYQALER